MRTKTPSKPQPVHISDPGKLAAELAVNVDTLMRRVAARYGVQYKPKGHVLYQVKGRHVICIDVAFQF